MRLLPQLRGGSATLPQYKLLSSSPTRSPPSLISSRVWTAARISILCSFLVISVFVWNCRSQLVPETLQHLPSSGADWFHSATDAWHQNATKPLIPPPAGDSQNGTFESVVVNTTVVADNKEVNITVIGEKENTEDSTPKPVVLEPTVDDKAEDLNEGSPLEPQEERIDIVYTWVNGSDPEHLALKKQLGSLATPTRYDFNLNELRYSLRSLDHHLPWLNGNIYIVTPGQIPNWLDTDHPRIKIINQDDILPKESLPTCNAFFLEFYLDLIPGLSEKFIYMNDDYFLLSNLTKGDFFTEDGRVKSFPNGNARKATIGDFTGHEMRLNKTQILGTDRDHDEIWQTSMSFTVLKVREMYEAHTVSFYHLPFVWERSIMAQVRDDFNETLIAMYPHKFRHWRDLQAPSVLFSKQIALSRNTGQQTFEVVNHLATKRVALFGACSDKPKEVHDFERFATTGQYKYGNMNADFQHAEAANLCRVVLSRIFNGASQYELADVSEGLESLEGIEEEEEEEEEQPAFVRVPPGDKKVTNFFVPP